VTNANLILALLVPLIGWRVYKRVRRNIGRQRSRAWRHWAGALLCPMLLAMFATQAWNAAPALASLAGGVLAGFALAGFGLRITRFEQSAQGFYYTPNTYMGVGLSLLLVSRVVYRVAELYAAGGNFATDGNASAQDFARSPLTLAIVGVVFGYYALYSAGLLRWRLRAAREPAV
jgi:hypothetical protein